MTSPVTCVVTSRGHPPLPVWRDKSVVVVALKRRHRRISVLHISVLPYPNISYIPRISCHCTTLVVRVVVLFTRCIDSQLSSRQCVFTQPSFPPFFWRSPNFCVFICFKSSNHLPFCCFSFSFPCDISVHWKFFVNVLWKMCFVCLCSRYSTALVLEVSSNYFCL